MATFKHPAGAYPRSTGSSTPSSDVPHTREHVAPRVPLKPWLVLAAVLVVMVFLAAVATGGELAHHATIATYQKGFVV